MLLTLFLVLLSQADDLANDFNIEAVALRLLENLSFAFVQFPNFFFDFLNALDNGPQLITRNVDWPTMFYSR